MDTKPSGGMRRIPLTKFVSAGALGAQRTALDWAIANSFQHAAYAPESLARGWMSLGSRYRRVRCNMAERDCLNAAIQEADALVIFTTGQDRSKLGSLMMGRFWEHRVKCPTLHLWSSAPFYSTAWALRDFLVSHSVRTICVVGSAPYEEDGVDDFVRCALDSAELIPTEPDYFLPLQTKLRGVAVRPEVFQALVDELRRAGWTGGRIWIRSVQTPEGIFVQLDDGYAASMSGLLIEASLLASERGAISAAHLLIEPWRIEKMRNEELRALRIVEMREQRAR